MERLISVGGLLLLVGIAYIFSKKRSAIKLRTVLWGLALQLIFALIILSRSNLSFVGMYIFLSLIILYMFEQDLEKAFKKKWLSGLVVLLIGAIVVGAFYFADGSKVIINPKSQGIYQVKVDYQTFPLEGEAVAGYDEVTHMVLAPESEGYDYAFAYTVGDESFARIGDNTPIGPFESVDAIHSVPGGGEWIIEYTADYSEEGAEVSELMKYYKIGEEVLGPFAMDYAPEYSEDMETWAAEEPTAAWYIKIGEEVYGPFAHETPARIGGINYYVLFAIGLFILVFSILKKKSEKFKDTKLTKYGFGLFLLVSLGTVWARGIYGARLMAFFSEKIAGFLSLTDLGTAFLFENLTSIEFMNDYGFSFAISVLPTIIFFSAFMAILYHFGVIQVVVSAMAKFMRWTMGTSGSETLSCSSNIFVGQTEAPLLVKPYLKDMTKSELHAIMVGGFATIAGGVLAGYIKMGVDPGHLIAASVMSAPAALMIAKILYPEIEKSKTAGDVEMPKIKTADNVLGAAANGVTDGLNLALNVAAMLLAFIALIGMVDMVLGYFDRLIDGKLLGGALIEGTTQFKGIIPGSLQKLFGVIFSPIAFMMGVPWAEAQGVGFLLGTKIAVNEFVAYGKLAEMIASGTYSAKSIVIATYALCGFANFSSVGIQIGGIGSLVPERRGEISGLALRALMGGAIASWTTATIAAILF